MATKTLSTEQLWGTPLTKRVDDHPGGGEIMTKQDQRDATDINLIVANFTRGQFPAYVNSKVPKYGDFTMSTDLAANFQAVKDAEREFMQLPPKVRELCGNDPVTFLEVLADEGGRAALEAAGLTFGEAPAPVAPGSPPAPPGATQPAPVAPGTPVS